MPTPNSSKRMGRESISDSASRSTTTPDAGWLTDWPTRWLSGRDGTICFGAGVRSTAPDSNACAGLAPWVSGRGWVTRTHWPSSATVTAPSPSVSTAENGPTSSTRAYSAASIVPLPSTSIGSSSR